MGIRERWKLAAAAKVMMNERVHMIGINRYVRKSIVGAGLLNSGPSIVSYRR